MKQEILDRVTDHVSKKMAEELGIDKHDLHVAASLNIDIALPQDVANSLNTLLMDGESAVISRDGDRVFISYPSCHLGNKWSVK